MKKSILLLTFLALFLSPFLSKASHLVGITLNYEYLNTCTVRVKLKAYRDCTGSTGIPNTVTFTPSVTSCALPTPLGNWSTQAVVEVSPICPGTATYCNNTSASISGVEEYTWYRDYDMCAAGNCIFTLSWSTCCRNGAITSGAANQSMYIGATTLNNTTTIVNNAPQYTRIPFFYACAGQDYVVNQGAWDSDGDSLVYSLGPCMSGTASPVTYNAGYSPTSPLGSTWNFSIDPSNGDLHITANPGNPVVGVVCVYIEEYRNGTLIGNYVRDIQLNMAVCAPNTNPSVSTISNLSGAYVSGNNIFQCGASGPICFDVNAFDPDAGQTLLLRWNGNAPGATFTEVGNPSVTDSIYGSSPTGRFCVTPPTGSGVLQILFTAEDNACPIYGLSDRYINIYYGGAGGGSASYASATKVSGSCGTYSFTAGNCGATGLSYTWSGGGGLSSTQASFNHSYPGAGTYPWQVIITDGSTFTDTIMDTVVIQSTVSGVLISPGGGGSTITSCSGNPITLSGPAGMASYLWSTSATSPSITVSTSGTYTLTVTDSNGCSFNDLVIFTINTTPQPTALITSSATSIKVCDPQPVTLTGAAGYSTYSWSVGASTQSITVSQPGTYYLTTTDSCSYADSVVITSDSSMDLSGTVHTYNGYPLAGQKILVVNSDWVIPGLISASDTAYTDSTGYYEFCTVNDTFYFVKALPDSATYPNDMPTYYDTTLFVTNANLLSSFFSPVTANFNTLNGNNPGGPGFIGGLVATGANKTSGVGDPVPDLNLLLINKSTGQVVDHLQTDANGEFRFGNLAFGTYYIKADAPNVTTKNDSVPLITVDVNQFQYNSVSLLLHSTYLELDKLNSSNNVSSSFGVSSYPNPFKGSTQVSVEVPQAGPITIQIFDLEGKSMGFRQRFVNGTASLEVGEGLSPGMYFLRISYGDLQETRKIIKLAK